MWHWARGIFDPFRAQAGTSDALQWPKQTQLHHRNVLKGAFELGAVYDKKEEVIEGCRQLAKCFIKALSASLVSLLVEESVFFLGKCRTYRPMEERWRQLLNKIRTHRTCHFPSNGWNRDEINQHRLQ